MTDRNIPIQFRDFGVAASIDRNALNNIMLMTQGEVRRTAARALQSCVAKIDVTYADKNRSPQSGSAFLYSDQAYLLASAHVVYGCDSIRVSFDNGRFVFNGSVAYLPPQHEIKQIDLAIVKIEGAPHGYRHDRHYIGSVKMPQIGDSVSCAGYAFNGSFQFTTGIISNVPNLSRIIVTNATDSGTSGGPCVDQYASCLIGVVQGHYGHHHDQTRVLSLSPVKDFFNDAPEGVPILLIQ
ncbi:hypothetical protein MP228_007791 [Amoeboaphelidium protococcarum]|nr:hypothetical protein MP228_007791 [Amoeboaphelidium protococcarum]